MIRTGERRERNRRDAVADLVEALRTIGVNASAVGPADQGVDVAVRLADGSTLAFEVEALVAPSPSEVASSVSRFDRVGTPVLVADRLAPATRDTLNQAGWGWLDRRGHLRLRAGNLIVDTEIPGSDAPGRSRPVLETDVGLDVACALLAYPDDRLSVRRTVDITGRSLAAVHSALTGLRDAGLTDGTGKPLTPDLFWQVSPRWLPQRTALFMCPQPGDGARTDQLELGRDDIETKGGWALCDTIAANGYGAFGVVRGDYPPDFYVPTDRIVRVARQLYGDAITHASCEATVAVPQVAWACRRRVGAESLARDHPWAEWPAVHPVFVALDLAVDPSRGREILDGWTPPEPFRRVW